MSSSIHNQRWMVDSGILRKKSDEEETKELLVFGYTSKLFRDDEKAKFIDQGKHLIPWMGDSTLKIDRYDGRGTLGDLSIYEPPPGGYDYRTCLTEDEYKIEQLCDEERYKSLYSNEIEDSIYHEEEIKRLHKALDSSDNSYNQVGFSYNDEEKKLGEDSQSPKQSDGSQDDDQLFVPDPELEIPEDMVVPETQKHHAIIAKTAFFISQHGGQMEVLIKAKQAQNPQFSFLSMDDELHPYYKHVIQAIKSGKYLPEKQPEKQETEQDEGKSEEDSDEEGDTYLHPSLVSSLKVESAPSIPSISYKPSEDCAYSMLVNKITGKPPSAKIEQHQQYQQLPFLQQQHGEIIPPPPMPPGYYAPLPQNYSQYPSQPQQYSHGPIMYTPNGAMPPVQPPLPPGPSVVTTPFVQTPQKEPTPLVPYGPTPPKPLNRPSFIVPPADIQIIIDKMASYVAKNGRDFEAIVKSKGDPRFNFLELSHQYHGYYAHKLTIYEGDINPKVLTEEELLQKQESQEEKQRKLEEMQKKQQRMEEVQKRVKMIQAKKKEISSKSKSSSPDKQLTTVSFSIKKPKEGDGNVIEKRNALPVEESDEDSNESKKESKSSKSSSSPSSDIDEQVPSRIKEDSVSVDKKAEILNTEKKVNFPKENTVVDLTAEVTEDNPKNKTVQANNEIEDKLDAIRRKLLKATGKNKQLQMERRKKAAMFLSQIQSNNSILKAATTVPQRTVAKKEDEIINLDPSPPQNKEESYSKICLSSRIKKLVTKSSNNSTKRTIADDERPEHLEIEPKRIKYRSRSRSCSRSNSNSERHRVHKKHKKKKSSHKTSYSESTVSSTKSHEHAHSRRKSKKSKKSSSRHRSRSRSPSLKSSHYSSHHRHRHQYRDKSTSDDSSSSDSS